MKDKAEAHDHIVRCQSERKEDFALLTSPITARSNDRIKAARALTQAKERRLRGQHLVEGEKLVLEALQSGCCIDEVFIEEAHLDEFLARTAFDENTRITPVSRAVMEVLSESKTPQHSCAVVKTPETAPPQTYPDGLIVVLDCVQDPGNVGTILRTADALGACALFAGSGTADPFSGKTLRAAMGSTYHLPIYTGNVREELLRMHEQGFTCIAGHLKGNQTFPMLGRKTALVIGNEGNGVSDEVADCCELYKLSMRGRAESLNAAIAAALLIYELSNQMEV